MASAAQELAEVGPAQLIILAAEVNKAHEGVCLAAQSALDHARCAGELLIQAKDVLDHGAWLPWLEAHCPAVSARMAQGYMRIAREWPRLEPAANAKRVAYLPVREALALLAAPRPPAELLPESVVPDLIDWPARTAAMEAAWEDLGAELDAFAALPPANDLEEAADRVFAATEIEGRVVALSAQTRRDLGRLVRELDSRISRSTWRHLMNHPDAMEEFLGACNRRGRELTERPA